MKQTFLQKLAAWIFGVWCFVIAGFCIYEFFWKKNCALSLRLSAFAAVIIAAAVLALLSRLIGRLKNTRAITAAVFVLALAAQLYVALRLAPALFSDYKTFYIAADNLFRGKSEFTTKYYYWKIWAYQFGFPWLLSLICRVFQNDSVKFCLAVNAVFSAGSSAMVTAITARFGKPSRAALAGLVFTVLPITLDLSAVLTNQQIGLFFILAALLVLSGDNIGWRQGLLAGLLLAISKVARADIIVILLAIIAAAILLLTKDTVRKRPEGQQKKVLAAVLCVAVCFGGSWLVSFGLQRSGVQPAGLANNFPLYKFAVGFDARNGGRFDEKLGLELFDNPVYVNDPEMRDRDTKALIKQELSVGPQQLWQLMLKKCENMWGTSRYSYNVLHGLGETSEISIGPLNMFAPTADKLFGLYEALFRGLLYAGAGLGGIMLARRRKGAFVPLIAMLGVLALSSVSVFIEVQYRYAYLVMPEFCMMLAYMPELRSKKRRAEE
jgi:hypothetical protein